MDRTKGPPGPVAPALALTALWLECWRQARAFGWAALTTPAPDLGKLRRTWLAELSQTTDSFLRSPAFLSFLRGDPR